MQKHWSDMKIQKELIILLLSIVSEIGMAYEFVKPNYFFCSSMVIVGMGFMVARLIVLIKMAGMAVFAIAVHRGNMKGRLHISYIILLVYSFVMVAASILPRQYMSAVHNEKIEMNALIYLITMILAIIVFTIFIFREKGAIRIVPRISSIMLMVVIGQFVTNGVFINNGSIVSGVHYLLFGLASAFPYFTIFLFEYFILEPTMLKYN